MLGRSRPRRRPSGGGARHPVLVVVAKGPKNFVISVLWCTTRFEAMAVFVARLLSGAAGEAAAAESARREGRARVGCHKSSIAVRRWLPNIVVDWRRRVHQWWRREAKVILLGPGVSRLTALVVGSENHASLLERSGVHHDWCQSF